jgi:hypothetical protein
MGTLDTRVSKEAMLSSRLGNIKIWRSTMKSFLMKEDLWDLVDDIALQPESSGKNKADSIDTAPLTIAEQDKT